MKFKKAIGCLVAFTALVASGISFSGVKPVSADDIPVEEHYVVPAGTVTPAYSYSDGPSSEPKYSGSTGYRSTATGSDGIYYYFSENDTTYGRMNVASTWSSYRGEGVKVAVIDTGCYSSHEDFSKTNFSSLSKNIYNGGTSPSDYNDTNGHGTSSVSTIAASINSVGGLGIAPNVELVVLKIDHPTYGMQVSYMNTALQWCIDNHVDVINMSVQGYASSFSYSYTEDFGQVSMSGTSEGIMGSTDVSAKLNACYNAGITVVAAAGNYNSSNKSYPAANDHVIAVASTGLTEANKNKKAGYSNYGEWVDICAPGYIMTPKTSSTSSYSITYGTSFSSPLVAGAIALYKCKYPSATPDQIERALKFTADKLSWSGSGAGAINVGKFLNQAPDYVYVESLSLGESTKTLTVGDTYTLHPTISPSNAANKNIIYESSDPAICDVDSNGVLTAKSVGQDVYIYATSEENSDVYDAFVVNVEASSDTPQNASVSLQNGTYTGSGSSAYITWNINNVITIKQEKGTGIDVANYVSAPRWYQNNVVTFTPNSKTITKLEITCTSNDYATALKNSTWSTGTPSVSGSKVTWTGEESSAFTVKLGSQSRISKIDVTYISGGSPTPITNYTVTFNSNGGSGTMQNQTTTGSTYTTPSCSYTKSGYTFSYWALNSTSGDAYSSTDLITNITADITLYAIWVESHSGEGGDTSTYYSTINTSLTGSSLQNALNGIITKNVSQSYDWSRFEDADEDPNNSNNVIMIYARTSVSKSAHVSDGNIGWNREHTFPQSKLGSSISKADNHIVYASDAKVNGIRGNKPMGVLTSGDSVQDSYGHSTTCLSTDTKFDPRNEARGIVARSTMYAAVMYGYDPAENFESIATMLSWHLDYPVTSFDQGRNNKVYANQNNRNPFVDHPEYACKIWGRTNNTTKTICGIGDETLTLSQYSASLESGENFVLTATASGGTGNVGWTTSNSDVASISSDSGNSITITAGNEGTAKITASYGSLTQECAITVTSSGGVDPTPQSDTETIVFSDKYSADTVLNGVTVNGKDCSVAFAKGSGSNDPKYFSNGTSARVYSGNTFTVSSSKTIVKIELTFGSSDGSNTITTDKQTYSSGTWVGSATSVTFSVGGSSGNRRIASIKITYENSGGSSDPMVNSIDILANLSLDVYNNKTYTFYPEINADPGADTTVTWESSDPTVASINSTGIVTALKAGNTTITATCGGKSDTCSVTVTDSTPIAVTGVTLNKSSTSICLGSTETLVATVLPANATNKNVTWTSSAPSKATVSDSGVVTPVAVGSTTITVRTVEGGYTATCTVTITSAPVITYQLEADVSEVPFNSGADHVQSVGVKIYQYTNGVKGDVVSPGNVDVDTSSLGNKTLQYSYNDVLYSTTIKVTNHESAPIAGVDIDGNFSGGKDSLPSPWTAVGLGNDYAATHSPYKLKFDSDNDYIAASVSTSAKTINVSIGVKMLGGNNGSSFTVTAKDANGADVASTTLSFTGNQNDIRTPSGSINNSNGTLIKSIVFSFNKGSNVGVGTATITADGETGFESKQALAWATYFINETRTADTCLAEQDSQKLAGLQAKWAGLAYEYTEMIGDSKDKFCTSSDATIVAARTHYLYIVSKFGAENLGTDGAFVKDSEDHVLRSKQYNPLSLLTENTPIAIIAVLSFVSVSAVGLFLYAKKRKEE